ncbi:MAG: PAS domain S-box protein, partial [bacterium]
MPTTSIQPSLAMWFDDKPNDLGLSARSLERVLEMFPVPAYIKDRRGHLLFINAALRSLLREASNPEGLVNAAAETLSGCDRAAFEHGSAEGDCDLPLPLGSSGVPWRIYKTVVRGTELGDILIGVAGSVGGQPVDKALRDSGLQFRLLWEHSFDGMQLSAEDGTILFVNDAFCRIVGLPREELIGRPACSSFIEPDREWLLEIHRRVFQRKEPEKSLERRLALMNGR